MLIANRTSKAETITLSYHRQHLPTGRIERFEVAIVVDDGEGIVRRAYLVLYEQLNRWNQGREWKYWNAD